MPFFFGKVKPGKAACRLNVLRGVKDTFELHQGKSRLAGWPADAHYEMDKSFPDKIGLEDVLENVDSFLVASERAKSFFEAQKLKNIEYLPVSIMNHKGRKEQAPYFIIHPLVLQDCLDLTKTQYEPNAIEPEVFSRISNITLDESKIDPGVALFRMRHYPFHEVYREELADKIKAAGLTGLRFVPVSEFSD